MRKIKIELTDEVYQSLLDKAGKGHFAKFISGLIEGYTAPTAGSDQVMQDVMARMERLETLVEALRKEQCQKDTNVSLSRAEPKDDPVQALAEEKKEPGSPPTPEEDIRLLPSAIAGETCCTSFNTVDSDLKAAPKLASATSGHQVSDKLIGHCCASFTQG